MKVVGVGSVGTTCMVALLTAADNDPLFLQVKQANASVLEPYRGELHVAQLADRAIVKFAERYADQTESDFERMRKAARAGRIEVAVVD